MLLYAALSARKSNRAHLAAAARAPHSLLRARARGPIESLTSSFLPKETLELRISLPMGLSDFREIVSHFRRGSALSTVIVRELLASMASAVHRLCNLQTSAFRILEYTGKTSRYLFFTQFILLLMKQPACLGSTCEDVVDCDCSLTPCCSFGQLYMPLVEDNVSDCMQKM